MQMSSAHLLLILLNVFGIRLAASANQQLMRKFAPNCTGVNNHPEQCVYDILENAYSQGYEFTEEEKRSMEGDLRMTECMDDNDSPVDGCILPGGLRTKQDVNFILWTREGTINNFNENDEFNGNNPTYFIFHGFFSKGTIEWITQAKDGLLETKASANVISVDWQHLSSVFSSGLFWSYCSAVANIKCVAESTSDLILSLVRNKGLHPSNVHLIGHSLGAHAAGITSKILKTLDNDLPPVATITGLDPAGPLFFYRNSSQKLNRGDAAYVQVIHTNGGTTTTLFKSIFTGTFGYFPPLGDDDFYPNGGMDQPGCAFKWFCDHSRAYEYWIESVHAIAPAKVDPNGGGNNPGDNGVRGSEPTPPVFTARTCDSWDQFQGGTCDRCSSECAIMGYFLQANRSGRNPRVERVHYLKTNSEPPFAIEETLDSRVSSGTADETSNILPIAVGLALALALSLSES